MEAIDDDFGDLYADVEVQATSAVDGVPDFARLYLKPGGDTNNIGNKGKMTSPDEGIVGSGSKDGSSVGSELAKSGDNGPSEKISGLEVDGTDSEDDLNIVLNDEDCKLFPLTTGVSLHSDAEDVDKDFVIGLEQGSACNGCDRGNGVKGGYHSQFSQYKYMRPHAAAYSSTAKGNGFAGVASFSSAVARGEREDKSSSSGLVGPNRSAGMAQIGYGFSLPRYRTILDVNIDAFDQKPWRRSEVDITDFFNFGFDEESWKSYCNSLDRIRRQTSLLAKIPVYESSKLNQPYEAGYENGKRAEDAVAREISLVGSGRMTSPESKMAERGVRQWELPKGRAIQVEGSICERLPSMDVRRPRNRDSDVVIQITVQDSMENFSGSSKEDVDHMADNVHEPSENQDFSVDGNADIQSIGSANGDEESEESLEGNARILDRSPLLITASSPMAKESSNQVVKRQNHGGNSQSLDRNVEIVETISDTKEEFDKNACKTDPCTMETESSCGDGIQDSLTLSHFGIQETSEHNVHIDPKTVQKPTRRPSSNSDMRQSVSSDYSLTKDIKGNHINMETGYCKDSAENISYVRERRHHSRRLPSMVEWENPYEDYEASFMSDTDGLYDWDHSFVDHRRWKEMSHDLGSDGREYSLYHRERRNAIRYCGERFSDNYIRSAYAKKFCREDRKSFRDERFPPSRRKWNGTEYFLEERITMVDKDVNDRDWRQNERGLTLGHSGPLTYWESRQLISKYCSYPDKERDTRWRGQSHDPKFRRRIDDDHLLECNHADNFMQEKYGRFIPYTDRERNFLDAKYERHLPHTIQEDFGRRKQYGSVSSMNLDDSASIGVNNEYFRDADHHSLCSRSYREPHTANGRRWHETMSPRNDVYASRSTEQYERCRRKLHSEQCRDNGWSHCHNDAYNDEDSTIYPGDHDHCGRRRYRWQSNKLYWAEHDLISRHQDDELFVDEASFPYERISMRERVHAKRGSAPGGLLFDDSQFNLHGYKMAREMSSNSRIVGSSNVLHMGKLERKVMRCRDSVDLVVGEEKSSGRCSNGASPVCNGKLENIDGGNERDKKIKDFDICQAGKGAQPHISKTGSDKNVSRWQNIDRNGERGLSNVKDFNQSQIGKAFEPDISKYESCQNSKKWQNVGRTNDREQTNKEDIYKSQRVKATRPNISGIGRDQSSENWLDKFPVIEQNEALDLEEGQIVMEEPCKGVISDRKYSSESAALTCDLKKKKMHDEKTANMNKDVGSIDNHRILETLEKMEKRRERFKEPISVKKEPGKVLVPQVDPIFEIAENKHQRPTRKRRWAGS